MSSGESAWYERQATISKLLTYGAILILLASLASTVTLTYIYRADFEHPNLMIILSIGGMAIGGTFVAAVLAAFSAIIDLLIVHAEALRNR